MYQGCQRDLFESSDFHCVRLSQISKSRILHCHTPSWRNTLFLLQGDVGQVRSYTQPSADLHLPSKKSGHCGTYVKLIQRRPVMSCTLCWPCSSPSARILEREVETCLKDHQHMSDKAAAPPRPGDVKFKSLQAVLGFCSVRVVESCICVKSQREELQQPDMHIHSQRRLARPSTTEGIRAHPSGTALIPAPFM